MSEKTPGQIAHDIVWPLVPWSGESETVQRVWEQAAQAVADAVLAKEQDCKVTALRAMRVQGGAEERAKVVNWMLSQPGSWEAGDIDLVLRELAGDIERGEHRKPAVDECANCGSYRPALPRTDLCQECTDDCEENP